MNALYPIWKEYALQGADSASLAGRVKATFVPKGYVFSRTHQFVTDLGGYDNPRYGEAPTICGKTFSNGTFDAFDTNFESVTGQDEMTGIVIYVDTGDPASSRLVLYLDKGIIGIPFTPSGGDVMIQWNAAGIFTL